MTDDRQRARDMAAAEFGVSWDGLNQGRPFIDRVADLMLAFANPSTPEAGVEIPAGEVRNEALRDAAAIAMTHAIKAGGAEGRARRAAATDGSIAGQQVEIEYAVAYNRMGRTAHTIAKQILSYIPGAISDPALPDIDNPSDLVPGHAAEWLRHIRSDEPLMRHTAADNLERVIQLLALTKPTPADIPTNDDALREKVARVHADHGGQAAWWWKPAFDDGFDATAARLREDDLAAADAILAALSTPSTAARPYEGNGK